MALTDTDTAEAEVRTIRSAADLVVRGFIGEAARPEIERVTKRYALSITPDVADLIDVTDPGDPIARQYVPDVRELNAEAIERADPIGDIKHSPVEGIVHRYPDRVLFKLVHVCAVYCRFCFRREMVGPGKPTALSDAAYQNALGYIRARPEIWEVILTGGDPLMLSARRMKRIVRDLAGVPHVRIVRVHSRIPAADPDRVTPAMVEALRCDGATTWLAVHANHPREFTAKARAACARLVDSGVPLVSQSVLLRGVNDDVATLEALMRCFVECRIKPYYLHHGDLAPGTAHLRTSLAEGQALMAALRGRVSGLCQPEYVVDLPGGFGKAPAGPAYVSLEGSRTGQEGDAPRYRIVDYCGEAHVYPPQAAGDT
jgi:lysine 2,3-aminomutase